MKIILFALAVFFNYYWIWYFYIKKNCKKEVTGIYIGKSKFRGRGSKEEYILVFRYNYQGTEHEEKSFETYRKKVIGDKYIANKEYPIFVNEKHPKYYVLGKDVQPYDLMLIGTGLIFAIIFFMYIFTV